MHDVEHARLAALFAAQAPYLTYAAPLKALGLTINLRLESPKLAGWLKAYMNPIYTEADNAP